MQMVKHKNEPKKAMILSKDGKTMANTTIRAIVKIRITKRAIS